jgi:hypothetical protein
MRGYVLVAFAVFFACCVAQFWFMKRVREVLIERHSDTFLAIEKSSIFPNGGLRRFLRKGRYKQLNDPELDKRVRDLKRLYLVAFAAWVAYGISIFSDPIFRH